MLASNDLLMFCNANMSGIKPDGTPDGKRRSGNAGRHVAVTGVVRRRVPAHVFAMILRPQCLIATLLSILSGFTAGPVTAAPDADLWPRWQAHDPASTITVDHSVWDRFLGTYRVVGADGIARVAYGRVDTAARKALGGYIDSMASVPISRLTRDAQRAYWVNLYNALTVRVVLDHYPVASIRDIDISPGLFSDGPWGRKLIMIEGEEVSLDDIEHRILRPIWRDPRLHCVLNCASLGCPDLPPQALTAGNAEASMEAAARAYVNHPRGVRIEAGGAVLSSLYDWYRGDFGDSDAAVLRRIRGYAAPPLARRLDGVTRISGYGYDWKLNDASGVGP